MMRRKHWEMIDVETKATDMMMQRINSTSGTKAGALAGRAQRAFTLVELLVVISIIVIGTTLILPAFSKLLQSANYSAAVNAVTVTLGNARALAIQDGRDTGVAFLFDIETKVYSLVPLQIGFGSGGSATLTSFPSGPREHVYARPFHPAQNQPPVLLPARTGVFGLALGSQIAPPNPSGTWDLNSTFIDRETAHWYAGQRFLDPDRNTVVVTPWLYPRNDPRLYMESSATDPAGRDVIGDDPWSVLDQDGRARIAVRHANSFFVQFNAQGSIVPSSSQNPSNAFLEYPDLPIDLDQPGSAPYDNATTFDPELVLGTAQNPTPNPEVVLRSVDQLAVVDLAQMTDDLGIERPWLVQSESSLAYTAAYVNKPNWLDLRQQGNNEPLYFNDKRMKAIGLWVDRNADVLSFNRYTGNIVRRTR